jgi:hypothetical protein
LTASQTRAGLPLARLGKTAVAARPPAVGLGVVAIRAVKRGRLSPRLSLPFVRAISPG